MNSAEKPLALDIELSNTQSYLAIDRGGLEMLARGVLEAQGVRDASISIALVDNATIHSLNRRHLEHDWPTDVISFNLSEPDASELAGELVISAEMAAQTAQSAGFDAQAELALYLVHGLLHLCGYDDRAPADVAAMRRREAELLAAAGFTHTFSLAGGSGSGLPGRENAPCSV